MQSFDWRGSFDISVGSSVAGNLRLQRIPVELDNGRAVTPESVMDNGIKRWEQYIVVFFVGRRLAFPSVKKHLESRWKLKNSLDIKLEINMFYIKLESKELRRGILDAQFLFWEGFL